MLTQTFFGCALIPGVHTYSMYVNIYIFFFYYIILDMSDFQIVKNKRRKGKRFIAKGISQGELPISGDFDKQKCMSRIDCCRYIFMCLHFLCCECFI